MNPEVRLRMNQLHMLFIINTKRTTTKYNICTITSITGSDGSIEIFKILIFSLTMGEFIIQEQSSKGGTALK